MKFLVFQHISVEHPGVLREFWKEAGIEFDAIELDEGEAIPESFDPYAALVVMGGPMDVWQEDEHPWLVPEKVAIRKWIEETGRPCLGICLGHQLLADAMGGEVGPGASEVGRGTVSLTAEGLADPLLAGSPAEPECFQWHSAEVKRLPSGCEVLAGNDACEVQAFRMGASAYGFQFHVEITEDTVAEWGSIPAYRASLEEIFGEDGLAKLAAQVDGRLERFRESARRLNDNFIGLLESRPGVRGYG